MCCPHQGRRLDYAPGKFLIDKETAGLRRARRQFPAHDGLCVAGPCRGESLARIEVCQDADGGLRFAALAD